MSRICHETRLQDWADLLEAASNARPVSKIDVDIAAILYTSGSTGKPKGVVLSHRNLVAGAESVASYLANSHDDVILCGSPDQLRCGVQPAHDGIQRRGTRRADELPAARRCWCDCAPSTAVTGLTCVPPLWIQVADQAWPEEAGRSLRYFANTGGKMPKATLNKLRAHFPNAAPFLMYGLTEAFRSTYLDPAEIDRRPDSIGKAIPERGDPGGAAGRLAMRAGRRRRTRPSRRPGRDGLLE